ncbi:hypothetical protein PRIPAC_83928, partial [Pristionchus pacificus]
DSVTQMKVALLISMLFVSCHAGIFDFLKVNAHVTVRGKLICSKPFNYRLTLVEEDLVFDEMIEEQGALSSPPGTVNYEVKGELDDPRPESTVEPVVTVEHSCGKVNGCVCLELMHVSGDVVFDADVNLEKTHHKRCKMCDIVQKKRGPA